MIYGKDLEAIITLDNYYLGQDIYGGIIFHLYIGSDGQQHGLIVSKTEVSATKWQSTSSLVNANSSWDGLYNFNLINYSPAKTWVSSLGSGWYLPSIDELSLLFQNRYHANKGLSNVSGTLISNNNYWSSTESTASMLYILHLHLVILLIHQNLDPIMSVQLEHFRFFCL